MAARLGARGGADSIISVDDVNREAKKIAREAPSKERIAELAHNAPYVTIDGLNAGYGKMEILHDFNLQVAKRQSLCLIGPNGAGKSTVLHSIFGFPISSTAGSRSIPTVTPGTSPG